MRARSTRGADEVAEERRGARRARLELRVVLAGDEPGMVGELDHLDQAPLLESAGDDEARLDELRPEGVVHLVAVAMALVDDCLSIGRMGARSLLHLDAVGAEAHVPPRSSISFCSGRRSMTG